MYVVPIYIYYHVFGALGITPYWLIRYPGKTIWTIPISATNLSLNLVLNLFLIPRYGIIGVAISAFISACISNLLQFAIGVKLTPVPMHKTKIALIFLFLLMGSGLVYLIYYLQLDLFSRLLLKTSILVLFLLVMSKMEIFTLNELKSVYSTVMKR